MAESDQEVVGGGKTVTRRGAALIIALWLALVAFDIWFLLLRPDASWETRIAYVLGLLGVYTFAFALLAETDLLKKFPDMAEGLTSPHPLKFLAGNLTALSLLFMTWSVGLQSLRTPESLDRRGGLLVSFVEGLLMLVGALLLVVCTVVYAVVVAPIAWLAYVVVSAPLDSVVTSGRDVEFAVVTAGETSSVTVRALVGEHLVALRNLLVAVPALVSSLILDAPGLF